MKFPKVIGQIELFSVSPSGEETVLMTDHNTVQYEGFDALGLIMSGQVDSYINTIYFQYDTSASGTARDVSNRTLNAADFRALSSPLDFARIQMGNGVTTPETSYGGSYSDNKITFTGVLSIGDVGEGGLQAQSGDKVEIAALVVAPSWSDNTQDKVYAAWAPATPVALPATGGMGLRWNLIFVHAS